MAKVLKVNADSTVLITLEGNEIEEVETLNYLGYIIDKQRGTDTNVKGERSIYTAQEYRELQSVVITHDDTPV